MRITFIVRTLHEASGGGSHYNAIQYIRALRDHGHSVDVHVFYQKGNMFPEDIVPVVHEGFGLGLIEERDLLANILRSLESNTDIFFLYGADFIWGGGRYRKTGLVPVVVYLDAYLASMGRTHVDSWEGRLYGWKRYVWDKIIGLRDGRRIDRFLPCSPFIGDVYASFGFPKDRFTVVPNIVPNTSNAKSSIEKTPGALRILYVGRLTYDKGVDLLIEALARLKQYAVKLIIVGDGELRPEVERLTALHSLDVEMVGWVTQGNVARFYEDVDIFVHPARYPDPAPRTIVDALSHSLPVVVPQDGGSAWIAGKAGIVFPNGSLSALTRALETLFMNTDDIRSALSAKGILEAKRFEKAAVYLQLESALLISATHT